MNREINILILVQKYFTSPSYSYQFALDEAGNENSVQTYESKFAANFEWLKTDTKSSKLKWF